MPPSLPAWQAVGELYHAYVTGLILSVITRRGAADAAEFVFRIFRRLQREKFLPGLAKLGLRGLPHAVACAQYHYLSNDLGGVRVEYMHESDRKAWGRYVPPSWLYDGEMNRAKPSDVTRAILRGWHANNGVLLGNPRLGFVCTKMTTDGQPGLEGYYLEADRALADDERLRFAPDEEGPDFDPAHAPRLDSATWPPERLAKAMRNYAMTYVRTMLLELVALFGEDEARRLGEITGRLIGMQLYATLAALLDVKERSVDAFADFLGRLGAAQGDDTTWTRDGDAAVVGQATWRLMAGERDVSPAAFDAWNDLGAGALSVPDRRGRLTTWPSRRGPATEIVWRSAQYPRAAASTGCRRRRSGARS